MAVSVDDVAALRAFHAQEGFSFPLLSDPDGRMGTAYGVMAGACCQRASFVLDERGVVRHVDTKIRLSRHGSDLAERLRELRR